jgi:hypothetical protein
MANTERFNTLQRIVIARKQVNQARQASKLKPDQRNLLDTTYAALVDIEDLLILKDIRDSVDRMRVGSKRLSSLVSDYKAATGRLKKIAQLIADAAKALGALADIATKAAAAGI